MECPKKNRSSYQNLKEAYEYSREESFNRGRKLQIYYNYMLKIAILKGPDLIKAPELALEAIKKADEEK